MRELSESGSNYVSVSSNEKYIADVMRAKFSVLNKGIDALCEDGAALISEYRANGLQATDPGHKLATALLGELRRLQADAKNARVQSTPPPREPKKESDFLS